MKQEKGMRIWLGKEVVGIVLTFLAIFLSAGDWQWRNGWLTFAIILIAKVIGDICLLRTQKALLIQRAVGERTETKSWDKVLAPLVAMSSLIVSVVAGLDERFGWSGFEERWAVWLGLFIIAAGSGLIFWAMVVNTYFDATVNIQTDRGHKVIDKGPYQLIRHPGYLGIFLLLLALPLALDSVIALIPSLVLVIVVIVRTALEDRTLLRELPGYQAYAEQVQKRLIPGVW